MCLYMMNFVVLYAMPIKIIRLTVEGGKDRKEILKAMLKESLYEKIVTILHTKSSSNLPMKLPKKKHGSCLES